jgi:hypothetical protein
MYRSTATQPASETQSLSMCPAGNTSPQHYAKRTRCCRAYYNRELSHVGAIYYIHQFAAISVHCLSFFNYLYTAGEAIDARVAHFVAVHGLDADDELDDIDIDIDEYTAASTAAYASYMGSTSATDDSGTDHDDVPESPEPAETATGECCCLNKIYIRSFCHSHASTE